jgi:diacylglycerol kinase (ATP)
MRKILLLVNPVFERHKGRDLPLILRTFEQTGAQIEVLETGENRAAGDKAKRAADNGVDMIVVCGGDGTVFDVLQGLAGSEVPLGIVPFGTGNVLAQNLRVPKDPVAAARWILTARPQSIPLGKITQCTTDSNQSWFFAMAAGMGVHAALMTVARRSQKDEGGRAAYFTAGFQLLFNHPLEPFEIKVTTTSGSVLERRVCEAIAVRVSELNLWRPGGGFDLPFLRLATVESKSQQNGGRWRLGRAAFEGLLLSAGRRDRKQSANSPARYEDVLRVECRPIPDFKYKALPAVQADGEVLEASCATIEMAGVNVRLLCRDLAEKA